MKITRRQLIKLISEVIDKISVPLRMRGQHNRQGYTSGVYEGEDDDEDMLDDSLDDETINEYRTRPSVGDPEFDDHLHGMISTGDPEYIKQADDLASTMGLSGDTFSKSQREYDKVKLMGEFAQLLTKHGIDNLELPPGFDLLLVDNNDPRDEPGRRIRDYVYDVIEFKVDNTNIAIAIDFQHSQAIDEPADVYAHVFEITETGLFDHQDTLPHGSRGAHPRQLNGILKQIYKTYVTPEIK